VIGGLLAGLMTTLFVVPALFSLVTPNKPLDEEVFEIPDRPSHMKRAEEITRDTLSASTEGEPEA
jgi:hypothetical protein